MSEELQDYADAATSPTDLAKLPPPSRRRFAHVVSDMEDVGMSTKKGGLASVGSAILIGATSPVIGGEAWHGRQTATGWPCKGSSR